MLLKAALAWLEARLNYLRWGVLILSWVGIAYATHHYDGLTVKAARVDTAEAKVKVVHDVKVIRDKVRAMPDAAIDDGLRDFYRD